MTEKKKLQEQVLQSQKMESMGVLAGGIAHDFNNVLTGILGHTEVLRRHVKSDEFGKKRIKTIEDAARRAGHMVAKLLSFARKESLELAPTDLNVVVKETVELLGRALIERHIDSKLMLETNVPAIMGDGVHLEQVLANLIMNSMDAMPGGGAIMIATSCRKMGPELAHISPFLAPGEYVVLTIRDTGTGIPRRIMDRIFDPFFTTKPAGKGTGLGLAMVYGIVKSHKGEIRVESAEGSGTVFEIYFPASDQPLPPARETSFDLSLLSQAAGETVFIVDDEKDVLFYMRDILEMQGYKVFSADNPNFAAELFERISDEIDIVITDMVMPVMNGAELAGVLKEIKPSVKVIGMSGFEGEAAMHAAAEIDYFLKKPFDGVSLIASVQQMLAKS
jgi:nitrogen-specific signal transduction histidine kinase